MIMGPAMPEPAAAEAPVEAPEVEVAAATAETSEAEPSLFNAFDAQRAAAEDQMEDIFETDTAEVEGEEDGLPPPAYVPQAQAAPFVAHAAEEPETFVAPKAPAPGTPSPDALARLQAAVGKAPQHAQTEAGPDAEAPAEKSRFGINSLINRMTGHGQDHAPQTGPRAI